MRVYKDKQFLVFNLDDGSQVKYDFSTKTAIGKKGKPVNNLCTQLRGLTFDDVIECCEDAQYGKFLDFVRHAGSQSSKSLISNIGTILSKVPHFARFEQIFSAGINKVDSHFSYTINDIPKALIKLCRSREIILSNLFLQLYKENPDGYFLAYNTGYTSLTDKDINCILTCYQNEWKNHGTVKRGIFNKLINVYNYTAKALLNYIDYLKTFEALTDMDYLMRELLDYASMMKDISPKFDKYPRHFLTTQKIASRNHYRLKKQFDEKKFQSHVNEDMQKVFGDYVFIYPKCTQDVKDEAVMQNNCVASYISRVINGECDILFLRKKNEPTKSLVTIEVRNNRIVQARQKFNDPVTEEQQTIIDRWNDWYSRKTA